MIGLAIKAFMSFGMTHRAARAVAIIVTIALAFFLLWLAFKFVARQIDGRVEEAEKKGAVTERAQSQGKAMENVEKAIDAVERRDDERALRLCRENSRTPENCQ